MAAPRWFWCCLIVTGATGATTNSVSKTTDLEPTKSAHESRWKLRFVDVGFTGVLEPTENKKASSNLPNFFADCLPELSLFPLLAALQPFSCRSILSQTDDAGYPEYSKVVRAPKGAHARSPTANQSWPIPRACSRMGRESLRNSHR